MDELQIFNNEEFGQVRIMNVEGVPMFVANDVAKALGYSNPSKEGIEDIIRRIGLRAGVEKAHPHRFRRTAATNALNRGMPVQEVAQFLGHAKLETTMVYCTVDQAGVKYHHQKYLSA